MKYSWQRQIILETIQEHKEHLSAQQIYGYARERCPHISLGTVYRLSLIHISEPTRP